MLFPDDAIRALLGAGKLSESAVVPAGFARRCKELRLPPYPDDEAALDSKAHDFIRAGRHPEIRNDRERSANKAIFWFSLVQRGCLI